MHFPQRTWLKFTLLLIVSIFSWIPSTSLAHERSRRFTISAGYMGNFFAIPGGKVGLDVAVRNWYLGANKNHELQVLVGANIGVTDQSGYQTQLWLMGELGGKWRYKRVFFALSLGVGYVADFEVTSLGIQLDGTILGEKRERLDYLALCGAFAFEHRFVQGWGWYLKFSVGQTFSPSRLGALFLLSELGLRFSF